MNLIFISNSMDHIQLPLCDEFYDLLGGEFIFIACSPSSNIRKAVTCADINHSREYIVRLYEEKNEEGIEDKIFNADVVILGCAPEFLIKKRLFYNKLTFRYMERLYKTSFALNNILRRIFSSLIHHKRYQKYPLYMLCAGAYAAYDHAIMRNYVHRCYTWGYFPKIEPKNLRELFKRKQIKAYCSILWVGRFIELKHPDMVIHLAKFLNEREYNFRITMVGYGELEEQCRKNIEKYGLEECVVIKSALKPEQVRKEMDEASILLFTSDRREGWGAVVNEGMNSACAVVASAEAGVSPFLIKHEFNGLLYNCNNQYSFNTAVEKLVKDKKLREQLAENAYSSVVQYWNPHNAAEKFIHLSESLLMNKTFLTKEGPCSLAPLLKDGWFKGE